MLIDPLEVSSRRLCLAVVLRERRLHANNLRKRQIKPANHGDIRKLTADVMRFFSPADICLILQIGQHWRKYAAAMAHFWRIDDLSSVDQWRHQRLMLISISICLQPASQSQHFCGSAVTRHAPCG
jgi:hypothetical protein